MTFCYILNYSKENNFYKKDVLNIFKGKNKEYNLIFDNCQQHQNILLDDINVKKTKLLCELDLPEYYKCNYNEDIILYINEYNMIISTKSELESNDIKKIIDIKDPLIIFFY